MTSFPSPFNGNLWDFGSPGRGVVLDPTLDYSHGAHCVLLTTGSVNPAHFGHVDIMQKAVQHMQAVGFNILHCYISPSHDDYVFSKARRRKTTCANSGHRCAILDHCISEYLSTGSPLVGKVSTGRWESGQRDFVDYMDVASALLDEMRAYYHQVPGVTRVMVVYVCGEDHARSCFLTRGSANPSIGVVIVPRVIGEGSAPLEGNPSRRVYVVNMRAEESEFGEFSSTSLREILASPESEDGIRRALGMFGGQALAYCRDNGIYIPPPVGCRIVHISDTHNFLVDETSLGLPDGDILVHTGDFSNKGAAEEFQQFDSWLQAVAHRYRYRVVIFGNHDVRSFKDDFATMKSMLPSATHVLNSETVELCGLILHGRHWLSCYDSTYKLKAGVDPSTCPQHNFHEIPRGVHVLLTHGPSYGLHDFYDYTFHSGSRELSAAIDGIGSPVLVHLHGHIHESYGSTAGATLSGANKLITSNSAICDHATTAMTNQPRVISFPLRLFPHGTEPNVYDASRIYCSPP